MCVCDNILRKKYRNKKKMTIYIYSYIYTICFLMYIVNINIFEHLLWQNRVLTHSILIINCIYTLSYTQKNVKKKSIKRKEF